MAQITTAGTTNFEPELVRDMFNKVVGHSALAKLSAEKPLPFAGVTEFTFSLDDEVEIVGESGNKSPGGAEFVPVVIKPVKMVYQHRLTDEFLKLAEEKQVPYLEAFADGFAKKIARGLDIAAIHGVDPRTLTDASFKSTNSFDGLITNVITYSAADVDVNIDDAVQAVTGAERIVNGLALSPAAGSALSKIKVNGVVQYPEFRFGQNPEAFYGMKSDVNSTLAKVGTDGTPDQAITGDFENAFRWGYAEEIPLEIIEYGDPDGQGDLKRKNQIVLRSEAYIGWGILDKDSFAIVR